MIVNILIGVAVLSVLALAHEVGHYFTAKSAGVKVEEFGLGLPPRIFGIKRGEIIYSINAIPFGAFVKMAGEEDPNVSRSLASKSIPARLLVLSAGSLMNALVALILFSIASMVPQNMLIGQVVVEGVAPNSPAAAAGIEPSDAILSINGEPVQNFTDVHRLIQSNLGEEITILLERSDSTTEEVQVIPRWTPPEGQGATGITIQLSEPTVISQHHPFWKAVPMGITRFAETFVLYKNAIIGLILGTGYATVAGPVGIVQITGEVAQAGPGPLLEFAAFISLILAIVNLFPIPAVDGGRIAFVLLELVRRGKRISPRIEGIVHLVGFAMLIGVLMVVTYQDIARIIRGDSLLP